MRRSKRNFRGIHMWIVKMEIGFDIVHHKLPDLETLVAEEFFK